PPATPARLADGVPMPRESPALARVIAHMEPGRRFFEIHAVEGGSAAFAISTAEEAGRLTRIVGLGRARKGEPPPGDEAEAALARARAAGAEALVAQHRDAWAARWADADIEVDGDLELQRGLRFALYHLISSADPDSDLASVGARGLTGPGYRGHVFWDTEVFLLPFYAWTHPASARALLAYRYRTLDAARARAAALGYRGALFAWESADTGEDVTPPFGIMPDGVKMPILTGEQEHHIAADVAWAVWRYWEISGDDAFLAEKGAEIMLETARFWASRARRGDDGRFHIERVIGPDEYHETIDDNAFTNVLARWNIERAAELPGILARIDPDAWPAVSRRLGLADDELKAWLEVANGLVDGFDPKTKLFEQFAGFFGLEDVKAVDIAERPFAGDIVLGRERTDRAQMVKQADVLMLVHMLPEILEPGVAEVNYAYYEPRTSHGSSLSPAIHGALAARVGQLEDAVAYTRMAAALDLANGMGNASQGVHVATMGGLWQAMAVGFGGVAAVGSSLRIDPVLPPGWTRLRFPIRWRGSRVVVEVEDRRLALELDGPAEVRLGTRGEPRRLGAGRYRATRRGDGWSTPEVDR
ncbi:MAG TPA: glycosyl hydrolase family 65 protein, partial [Candidatus Binatia bacterium]|nr:glycosyl hydrolase family 65 protein [Candidatus Binatia bacterium]